MKRIISIVLIGVLLLGMVGMVSWKALATETETTEPSAVAETTEATESSEVPETTEETEVTEPSAPTEPSQPSEPTEPKPTDPPVDQGMVTSDACVAIIKQFEGFCKYPVYDYGQYTVGYGTRCPDDKLSEYRKNGIPVEDAEELLRSFLRAFEQEIQERIIDKYKLTLNQGQFDALVSFSFNCGTAWTRDTSGTFFKAITKGHTGNDLVRAFALWCSAGGEVLTYLLRRRLCEANMYLNAVYSKTPPATYCYVLYDANGGTTSPRTQGYNSQWAAAPYPVPTFAGYKFQGWYTERTGGTKVTSLTAAHNTKTLYAHWVDSQGNAPNVNTTNVSVSVTAYDVNVRSGPGTNYSKLGKVTKGDKLVITETATGSGYTWGKFDKGWIALQYTNYETAITQKPNDQTPETTPPETTQPTEPKPTEPTPTEPTEPKPTEPPKQETPREVYGIVKVQDRLRIRSGPGTGYSVAGYLKANERIKILEQKVVGSVTWAKISNGWVSMQYVVLENTNNGNSGNTGSTTTTAGSGTIYNCNQLRIRSGAGTNYAIVGYVYNGNKVTFTEFKKVGSVTWGKISKGWISLDYVKLDSASGNNNTTTTPSTPSTPTTSLTGTVKVDEWLRIRSGPGTSYAVAGYMKPNERVEILEQKTVGSITWGKTSKGWISMQYVVLDKTTSGNNNTATQPQTPAADVRTVNATTLYIRKAPGTGNTILGYLVNGTKVTILETKTVNGSQWGRISNGWICLDYTKK